MPNKLLKSNIESLLFISNKPLSTKQLAHWTKANPKDIEQAIKELMQEYYQDERGIQILKNNQQWQMVSSGKNAGIVQAFLKNEMTGELTQPALETLAIIAYRGPITKQAIEQIRGVNCSLILRNLMIKGLVEIYSKNKDGFSLYNVTFDFMQHLGINKIEELPDFEKLHNDKNMISLLEERI